MIQVINFLLRYRKPQSLWRVVPLPQLWNNFHCYCELLHQGGVRYEDIGEAWRNLERLLCSTSRFDLGICSKQSGKGNYSPFKIAKSILSPTSRPTRPAKLSTRLDRHENIEALYYGLNFIGGIHWSKVRHPKSISLAEQRYLSHNAATIKSSG